MLHAASQDLPSLRELGLDPEHDVRHRARRAAARARARRARRGRRGHRSASRSPRRTRRRTGRRGRSPSPGSSTRRSMSSTSSTCAIALVDELVEQGKTESRGRGVPRRAGSRAEAGARRAVAPAERPPHRAGSPGTSPSRASCGLRARTTPSSRMSRPVGSSPTPRSSPRAFAAADPKQDLADLREFTGRASRTQLDRWWAAIEAGLATTELPASRVPNDSPPPPRAWARPQPRGRRAARRRRVGSSRSPRSSTCPPRTCSRPTCCAASRGLRRDADAASVGDALAELGARPWQIEATAQMIADAFVEASQALLDATSSGS